EAVRGGDRLLDLGVRAHDLKVELEAKVLLCLLLGPFGPLDAEGDHAEGSGELLRAFQPGRGAPGQRPDTAERGRPDATLDEQVTAGQSTAPLFRRLSPRDRRVREVAVGQLVRVAELIGVLQRIELEVLEFTHMPSPFPSPPSSKLPTRLRR